MKTTLCLITFITLSTLLCFAQRPPAGSSQQSIVEREIHRLTRLWDEAMVRRDVNALDRILANDYVISGLTKSQYLELIRSSEINYTSFDREIGSLRVYGDTALVFGRANVNGRSSALGWFSSSFSFMDVWVKQQGNWRCVATKAEEVVQTYQRQRIVRFGPEVEADLVIVFKSAITDEQIENFRRTVLQVAAVDGDGSRYLSGIRQYLRVPQIQNHEAVALRFHEGITPGQREEIIRRVRSSSLVHKLFENIAPADVILDP